MGMMEKMRDIVFGSLDDELEDDYYEDEVAYVPTRKEKEREKAAELSYKMEPKEKVVSLHTNLQMEVVITVPENDEDGRDICDHVKDNKPVIVNLEKLEYPVAQRLMDFVSGGCYALGGSIQRVASNIFIIAPVNVDLSGDFKEELKSKGIFLPWSNLHK